MRGLNKRKNGSRIFQVNLFMEFSHLLGSLAGALSRETVVARTANCSSSGKRLSRGGLSRCLRSRALVENRSLFQRNFYIYPWTKRKPRICFHSRILLHHVSFRFSASFSALLSSFPVPRSSPLCALRPLCSRSHTRPANTRDLQRAPRTPANSPRASVHRQKWFTLPRDPLPRHTLRETRVSFLEGRDVVSAKDVEWLRYF